ncbi:MAG: hypothetical protein MUO88_05415, partial [Desulfobacterales bacterium]|nr:hypothetical protein [Desulfobacterales bacterium]
MNKVRCARCDHEVEKIKSETIELVTYCESCAKQVKQEEKEKKHKAKQEEHEKIKEREYIEKELEVITEDDAKHIIITTSDTIEVKRIGEYISVISAQEYKYNTDVSKDERAGEEETAEKDNRECMERALFKLKKQAYLFGAETRHSLKNDLKVPNSTPKTSESGPSAANALGGDPGLKPPPITQSTPPY